MVITKYITKTCIVPELEAKTKLDAIKELTHLLFDKKRLGSVAPALDQVVAREATESTGIGKGLAVPHARIPGMKDLACAIGRVPKGLDFMAIDREPVHLLFLICYPPSQQTTYLNFVATVSRLLGDKEHFGALMSAPDADAMYAALEGLAENFDERHEQKVTKLKTDPKLAEVRDGHADMVILARLQLQEELLASTKSGKTRIKQRIEELRLLVDPRVLRHYEKLMRGRAPALVPVEGDTCQGCFMRLPSKFVQQVRNDTDRVHTCINCSRYIYVV
jgi:nitrogen PTS system EIIA component